jgi:uncharacterized protein YjgD (DUF1641 family)
MKNYEEKKQELIVRQSQINSTIEYFKLIDKKPNISDIIKISTMMTKYVHNGYTKELIESFLKMDEHINNMR